MARVKGGIMSHKRRKKVLKLAKGYYGARHRLFRTAKQAVMKSGRYAFIGRKQKHISAVKTNFTESGCVNSASVYKKGKFTFSVMMLAVVPLARSYTRIKNLYNRFSA